MLAVSSPVRTRSADARPPTSRPTAPTRIDLPAPVSPVNALRPGPNSRASSSMTARCRILRNRSIARKFHPIRCLTAHGVRVTLPRLRCPSGACRRTLFAHAWYFGPRASGAGVTAGVWDRRHRLRSADRALQLADEGRTPHSAPLFGGVVGHHPLEDVAVPTRRAEQLHVPAGVPQEHQIFRGAGGVLEPCRQSTRRDL